MKRNDENEDHAKFMKELDADILCEGHFGVYRGKENIERFIRSFMQS